MTKEDKMIKLLETILFLLLQDTSIDDKIRKRTTYDILDFIGDTDD